jgi:hypothetical protein
MMNLIVQQIRYHANAVGNTVLKIDTNDVTFRVVPVFKLFDDYSTSYSINAPAKRILANCNVKPRTGGGPHKKAEAAAAR